MTTAVATRSAGRTVARRHLPYAWPLLAAFGLYPLWWVMGVHSFVWQAAAVPLALRLVLDRRSLRVPRGFGIWVLFLCWTLLSSTQLERAEQLGPFLYRFSLYLSATVFLLFVANAPRRLLPVDQVYGALTLFFVAVILGGWLGVALPSGEFTTPFESLLPASLSTNEFVRPLVHADFAQVQDFLGYPLGRPQAPFAYTNHWGSVYALLVPVVALGWARTHRSSTPLVLQILLTLSLVPALVSLNRGMALSLVAALVYASLRSGGAGAMARRVLAGLAVVFFLLMAVTPLGAIVQDRGENDHSSAGRETLYAQAIDYAAEKPFLGYGAPQEVIGNRILPPVGTQGQFWLVLVSQGWVGVVLFVWFLVQMGRVTRRVPDNVAVAHLLIVIVVVQMFVYELISAPMQILFVCLGLAVREAAWAAGEIDDDGVPAPGGAQASTDTSERSAPLSDSGPSSVATTMSSSRRPNRPGT